MSFLLFKLRGRGIPPAQVTTNSGTQYVTTNNGVNRVIVRNP